MERILSGRLVDYTDNLLYVEWMTLNVREKDLKRRIFGLWDVFAKVGGIINVFKLFASFFFTWYAEITFKIEAINTLLKVHTTEEESLKNNFVSRVSLMTPLCANKKLKRMLDRGT